MVNKKVNKFSIWVEPTDDCWIDSDNPNTVYNDTLLTTYAENGTTLRQRSLIRTAIVMGTDNSHQIPHFDDIDGCWLHLYLNTHLVGPEVGVYGLNDDVTKYFEEDGATWNHYKDREAANQFAGCPWREAGGDYEEELVLAHRFCTDDPIWKYFDISGWARGKTFEDGDIISLLMRDVGEGQDGDYAAFWSKDYVGSTVTLNTTSWRDQHFGSSGGVYWEGANTNQYPRPLFEIVYEDEVPEQPTDFKLSPDEETPEKVRLEFSESPDEDIQGNMLFVTSDPRVYNFDSLKFINYDGQTGNFTVGQVITGSSSGATAVIVADRDAGVTGTLVVRTVNGIFEDRVGAVGDIITDPITGSASVNMALATYPLGYGDIPSWGYVDKIDAAAETITCGMGTLWPQDVWNNYKLIMTNGRNKGKVYTISDTGNLTGVLTITEGLDTNELGINDMFIIVKDYTRLSTDSDATTRESNFIYAVETNRGYYWQEAPSDEYEIWIKDMTQFLANEKYHFFVQAIDNLGMGERGDTSNVVSYVIPEINHAKDFNIASVTDDGTGTGLDIYEEVYPAVYSVGLDNEETATPGTSTTGLKDKIKIEIETGEYRYILDTYVTTLTSQWTGVDDTIDLDLDQVPKRFFRVGQRVCIIDRDAASPPAVIFDIRTIIGVGDNTITVDDDPGHTFRTDTTQIYPVKSFIYTKTGTKSGIIKARTINEEGFASPWQTPNTPPAPVDIPGIGSLKVGPTEPDINIDTSYFNMNLSRPKDADATIAKYVLDKDDGSGFTEYDEPVQQDVYSAGTKRPFAFIYDSEDIASPGFGQVWDYVAVGPVWNDETVDARTYAAGSAVSFMNAVGDILYIGSERPFDGMFFRAVGFSVGLTFDKEYWDGSAWQTLAVTDETSNFTVNGKIFWDFPSDWASSSVNSSDTLFFVRLTVTAVTASGDAFALIPLESGRNFSELTAIDPVVIDLDGGIAVLKDGFESHVEEHPRKIYLTDGVLASKLKQGRLLTPTYSLKGNAHTISDNYLNGFNGAGIPQFTGAANTQNRPDDLQVINDIIDNGRVVQFLDDAGTTRQGFLARYSLPSRMEGHPVTVWEIAFIPDPDR
jgi:hypothetical protein